MTDTTPEPDNGQDLTSYVEELRRTARPGGDPRQLLGPLHERISAMTRQLAELQTQAFEGRVDDDDRVVAVVDGRGTLLRMRVSPFAMRDLDAAELSRACTEALAAARINAAESMGEALKRLTGFDLVNAPPLPDPGQIWQARKASGWNP
ncbi:YbaB/EbfC family nucleoid-associated protein [Tenggerimyces flavus]|uniref:YbaB/EbfC family nucleoid-associated protein n=1 Tax=Tenggerimyces flavus TaxID=1708749 RepID=A0ABV7YKX4_9ACTN|nr:YbaB/EbfC family nucleoid-associated protein [Tenggerimyces flavus]MBM7789701.1 DNA-binding protein YbaB [Tenggerimyces flavus]